MADFVSRIRSHSVFAEIENGQRAVAQVREGNPPTEIKEGVDRVNTILEFARSVLEQSDPLYLAPQVLEDIRVQAKGVRGELNNYNSSKNAAHIQSANDRCDQLVPLLRGLPIPHRQMGVDQYVNTFEEFRRTAYGYLDEGAKKVGELTAAAERSQQNLIVIDRDISQQKSRLDTAIAEFQKQFSEAQAARQSEFGSTERSRSTASADLLRQVEESHKAESEARQVEFDKWRSVATSKTNDTLSSLDSNAKKQIKEIEKLKSEAEKIVGLIGEHGMVRGYQAQADKSRGAFRFWSGIAVLALLCWVLFGLIAFWYTYDKELTWSVVARQFLVSTPFLLLATFAGYQAFVQQRSTTRFRRRELEMASLEPFLASLSREDSNEVKKLMVSKFFGHGDDDDTPPPPDLAAIVTGVADRLVAIIDKKRETEK